MKRLWVILFVISSAWGQSLNFTNKDSTIIIKSSQLVNLNGTRYTLIHTDYNKQHIVLETEIPDSAPFKYLREPIEGAWFYFGILDLVQIENTSKNLDKLVTWHWVLNNIAVWYYVFFVNCSC